MKRSHISTYTDHKWPIKLFLLLFISSLLLFFSLSLLHSLTSSTDSNRPSSSAGQSALPTLPRFAYLISGTKGDGRRIRRLLKAIYHPRNHYVLHLDLEASDEERLDLAKSVKSEGVLRAFRNVMVIGKADLLNFKGPTVMASTLHAVAVLLKQAKDWDWFVNLSAADYPLISQDDLLHIFSYLPRELNFLEHSSDIGWKENQRARPIIIDPGLYHTKKSAIFWAKERRSLPAAFKLFTGSEWVVLTKPFLDFCILGWDNLPRTLLMYYTNFVSSSEGYFHTVICNHQNYQNTTVNHDLRFTKWDNPPKAQPMNLTLEHFDDMAQSGSPFARRFAVDDPVLDRIDHELLGRETESFTPGGWCLGKDGCVSYGSLDALKPSVNSRRLEKLVLKLLDPEIFRFNQCK
ncbi:hypothetical protein V2J09_018911 [Rumex salicifolius]